MTLQYVPFVIGDHRRSGEFRPERQKPSVICREQNNCIHATGKVKENVHLLALFEHSYLKSCALNARFER